MDISIYNISDILAFAVASVSAQKWPYYTSPSRRRANVRTVVILPALLVGATLVLSTTPAAAWWQFVVNGPNGERQISPHFATERECTNVLKITETELAKKYPDRYPLVGSCEEYR